MLRLSVDPEAHVMLASMAGGQTSAEHQRVHAAIETLDRGGRERAHPIAMIFIVASDNPAPDADWRRRFAVQRKGLGSPGVFVSIVTRSPIMRGVLTAMNWIVPQPPHVTTLTHATFEECAAWVERKQGSPRVVLQRLRDDARSPPGESARHLAT
jgi:hypothetical protein